MKKVKDKHILVGADFAGFPLKEAVVAHLKARGWQVEDIGVKSPDDNAPELMFHRIGLKAGAMVSQGDTAALLFAAQAWELHCVQRSASTGVVEAAGGAAPSRATASNVRPWGRSMLRADGHRHRRGAPNADWTGTVVNFTSSQAGYRRAGHFL